MRDSKLTPLKLIGSHVPEKLLGSTLNLILTSDINSDSDEMDNIEEEFERAMLELEKPTASTMKPRLNAAGTTIVARGMPEQPAFQPGCTPAFQGRQFLVWNTVGLYRATHELISCIHGLFCGWLLIPAHYMQQALLFPTTNKPSTPSKLTTATRKQEGP